MSAWQIEPYGTTLESCIAEVGYTNPGSLEYSQKAKHATVKDAECEISIEASVVIRWKYVVDVAMLDLILPRSGFSFQSEFRSTASELCNNICDERSATYQQSE